jgi:hypothetical protein
VTGRTIAVALAVGMTAAAFGSGPANGDSATTSGLANLDRAASESPSAQASVAALARAARTPTAGATYAPFLYASPTLGCGSSAGPFTFTAAAGMGENADDGSLRFQATPAYSGVPTASKLSVAWLNLDSGASGIAALDGVSEYGLPTLSKAVETGPGTVVAALWGSVNYTDAICSVAPTVGEFTVGTLSDSP